MTLHGTTVRITVELCDGDGKPIACKHSKTAVGAGDACDVIANVERAASQTANGIAEQLATIASGGRVIVLDIREVESRNAIGAFLRAKAGELQGFTLYHPEHSLNGWANDIDPPIEELQRRAAELQTKPRKSIIEAFRGYQSAQLAELAKITEAEGLTTVMPGEDVAHASARAFELTRIVGGAFIEQQKAAGKWPDNMTPEHCRAVEDGFAIYAKSRTESFPAQKSEEEAK